MDDILPKLRAIHDRVTKCFEYRTDMDQYKVEEKWTMPDGKPTIVGDCEDFALMCRKLCRLAGIPTRLVICLAEGEGHCVLEASGWILDNKQRAVVSRDELNYNWYSISGYEPGDDWHLIK